MLVGAKCPKFLIESVVYAIGSLYVALNAFYPEKLRVIFPPGVATGTVAFEPHGTIVATVVTAINYYWPPDNFHATLIAPNLVEASSHFLPPMAHTASSILSSTQPAVNRVFLTFWIPLAVSISTEYLIKDSSLKITLALCYNPITHSIGAGFSLFILRRNDDDRTHSLAGTCQFSH
jgi:hypothetical protein